MLDLEARVHLQEVEIALGIHQKFDRPRIVVACRSRSPYGGLPHALPHRRVHQRRRTFLHDFLVPPLDAALALAQVDHVAMPVTQDLDFDVARMLQILFEINLGVAERVLGL